MKESIESIYKFLDGVSTGNNRNEYKNLSNEELIANINKAESIMDLDMLYALNCELNRRCIAE